MNILNETKGKYIMSHLKRIKRDLTACTASDIEEVIVALKAARNALHSRAMKTFDNGNRVMFTTNTGSVYRGFIAKKGVKYCRVRATLQDDAGYQRGGMSMWRVPASDLRHDDTAHPAGA